MSGTRRIAVGNATIGKKRGKALADELARELNAEPKLPKAKKRYDKK